MDRHQQLIRTILIVFLGLCVLLLVAVTTFQSRNFNSEAPPLGEGIVRLGDVPVVQVNGTSIYMSDVRQVAQAEYPDIDLDTLKPGDPVFRKVLDQLIDQRLMAIEALTLSLDQQKEAKRRLSQARERILGNVLVESHLRKTVNNETARQLFEAQAALRDRGQEVRARQIVVADETSAKQILDRLDKGESFEALALAYSIDRASRESAGDLGYFTNDMMDPILTQTAFSAAVGTRVPLFKTDAGWHILEVLDKRQAREPTFDEVQDDIKSIMTYDEISKLLKSLRSKARIERFPAAETSTPPKQD